MKNLYLAGFADEAANDLGGQIKALKTLNWKFLEARSIDGKNIHDLDDAAFEKAYAALADAGIGVNCFGSTIANWGTSVDSDIEATMATVHRAIARMKRLKVPLIRIMSYAVICDAQKHPLPDQKEEKRFQQLQKICGAFLDAGITPVHENCFNYGGMSWEHTLKMLDAVPGMKLVYDTGNPGLTPDFRKPFPYPNQDSYEVWENLKTHVIHIHIKDGRRDPKTAEETYFFPGEGDCEVRKILADALSCGYSGSFSIEPHMAAVFHDATIMNSPEQRFDNFIEYGNKTEELFKSIGYEVKDGAVLLGK